VKVFLDDVRTPDFIYPGETYEQTMEWVVVRDPEIFLTIFTGFSTQIDVVSLDHDLGDDRMSGYQALMQIVDAVHFDCPWYKDIEFRVHSANVVGADKMRSVIERYLCG